VEKRGNFGATRGERVERETYAIPNQIASIRGGACGGLKDEYLVIDELAIHCQPQNVKSKYIGFCRLCRGRQKSIIPKDLSKWNQVVGNG
jgi:hypothetical protein